MRHPSDRRQFRCEQYLPWVAMIAIFCIIYLLKHL